MDGNVDNLLDEMSKITGRKPVKITTPKIKPTQNPFDVPKILDDEFSKLGYSPNARLALISNVGRENNWNPQTIFGEHVDPASNTNGRGTILNKGIISWNDSRRKELENFVRQNGGDFTPNENNLRLQARFLDWEMNNSRDPRVKQWKQINQRLKSGDLSLDEAYPLLQKYIQYQKQYEPDNKEKESILLKRGYTPRQITSFDTSEADGLLSEMKKITGNGNTDFSSADSLLSEMQKITGLPSINPQNAVTPQAVPTIDGEVSQDVVDANRDFLSKPKPQPSPVNSQNENPQVIVPTVDVVNQDNQSSGVVPPVQNVNQTDLNIEQSPISENTKPEISAPTEKDFRDYLKFKNLPNTPENRAVFLKDIEANKDFGKVQVSEQINPPKIPTNQEEKTPVEIPSDAAVELKPEKIKLYKTAQEALESNVGTYKVDLSKKPKGMNLREYLFRASFAPIAAKYGIDLDVAMQKQITEKGGIFKENDEKLAAMGDKETADLIKQKRNIYTISYNRAFVNDLLGGSKDKIAPAFQTEFDELQKESSNQIAMNQAMERGKMQTEFTTDSLQIGNSPLEKTLKYQGETPILPTKTIDEGNGVKRTSIDEEELRKRAEADLTREALGFWGSSKKPSEEEINQRIADMKARGINPQQANVAKEFAENMKKNYGLFGTAFGGLLGGAARNLDWLNGIGKITSFGAVQSTFGDTGTLNLMSRISNVGKIIEEDSKYKNEDSSNTFGSDFVSMLGATPADLSRLGLQMQIPGGTFVAFPLDSALQSVGRGETTAQTFKETIKGGALGFLFHGAGVLGNNAKNGLFNSVMSKAEVAALENGTATLSKKADALLYLYGRGTTLATIASGTTALDLVSGNPLKESLLAGLQMGLFDALLKGKQDAKTLVGKIFKVTDGQETIPFTFRPKENSGDLEIVQLEKMPETADAIISAKPFPKETVKYNEDGSVKSETLVDKTVINKDGKIGTVVKDDGGKKVLIDWEKGNRTFEFKKRLTVQEDNLGEIKGGNKSDLVEQTPINTKADTVIKESDLVEPVTAQVFNQKTGKYETTDNAEILRLAEQIKEIEAKQNTKSISDEKWTELNQEKFKLINEKDKLAESVFEQTKIDEKAPLLEESKPDLFDDIFDAKFGNETRTKLADAKESAKIAVSETKQGLDQAGKALVELFSPDSFKSAGFPAFDEKTYQKAKPHFEAAIKHFKQAGGNAKTSLKSLIDYFSDELKVSAETILKMKPYMMKYLEEEAAGKTSEIKIDSKETIISESVPLKTVVEKLEIPVENKEAAENLKNSAEQLGSGRDSVLQTITNLRRAGLLTGVKTHLRNMSGNTAFQAAEEVSKAFGYFADVLASTQTGQRTISFVSPIAVAKSFKAVFKSDKITAESGLKRAYQILRFGDSVENLEKQQLKQVNSGSKVLDWYANSVFRTLSAEDALFKVYAFRRSLEEQATTLALTAQRTNSEIQYKSYRQQLLEKPDAYMLAEADLYADYATFQNKNRISDAIADGKEYVQKNWGKAGDFTRFVAETIAPFDKTPTNIILRTLDFSPFGYIRAASHLRSLVKPSPETLAIEKKKIDESVKKQEEFLKLPETEKTRLIEDLTKKLFTRQEQKAFAANFGRASTGTALMTFGFMLAQSGYLAGSFGYKDNKEEYFKRREKGIEPGSLLIPEFGRIVIMDSPGGKSMVLGATIYEQINKPTKKDESPFDTGMRSVVKPFWDIAADQPLLKASGDYLSGNQTLSQRGGSLIGSFVPTIISDAGEVLDDKPRSAKGFTNSVLRRIPIARRYANEAEGTVSPEERGNILRRAVRAVDPLNTRSPQVYKYGGENETEELLKKADDVQSIIEIFNNADESEQPKLLLILKEKANKTKNPDERKRIDKTITNYIESVKKANELRKQGVVVAK